MLNLLDGKRVLITQSPEFMGPVFCEVRSHTSLGRRAAGRPLAPAPDGTCGTRGQSQ